MIYGSWLPFVIVVSLVYAIFLLFTIIGLIYSKTKKQFFVFNYLKSENINIPIKKRKIYQISAISLKNNSIKTYINIKKPVSLLSFIFVLKKVYFFKCKKEGQYFFYPTLSYLLILVIIIRFVLVYFHESINLKYFK
ncbi:MAG: hypothetical protein E7Y34_02145, partial [Mycoplasma sp.]|nr:hypothetical protein [Mycoplasma sp.]